MTFLPLQLSSSTYHVRAPIHSLSLQVVANKAAFGTKLTTEIIRTLKIMVDYSEESHHDSLIRNSIIQTVLGISSSLGYNGDAYQRSFASMISWMTLQLRNCVVLTTMAVNIKVPRQNSSDQKMTGYEDPGMYLALGLICSLLTPLKKQYVY